MVNEKLSITFEKYDGRIDNFDPDDHGMLSGLFEVMVGGPHFPFVELTSGNVTFIDQPWENSPNARLRIEPVPGDEFGPAEIMMILLQSRSFWFDHNLVRPMINRQLDAGVVLTSNNGRITRVGQTFAGLRGAIRS